MFILYMFGVLSKKAMTVCVQYSLGMEYLYQFHVQDLTAMHIPEYLYWQLAAYSQV